MGPVMASIGALIETSLLLIVIVAPPHAIAISESAEISI